MSLFDKYLAGWQLRTTNPRLEPGTEVTLVVTDYDHEADVAIARVGDTHVRIEGAQPDIVDMRVRIEITDFEENDHAGTAELREVVGETMY